MLAYQAGDYLSFEELFRRHSGRVYGFLSTRVQQQNIVDDLLQETFTKLHRSRGRYDPRLPFLPWLFTICRNVLLDNIRARRRSREDLVTTLPEQSTSFPEESPNLIKSISAEAELSSSEEDLLGLRFRDDLTYQEIAARLETSPANARQLLSRLVRRLRTVLGRAK